MGEENTLFRPDFGKVPVGAPELPSERRCRHCEARGYKLRLTRPDERRFHGSPVGRHRQMVVGHCDRQQ